MSILVNLQHVMHKILRFGQYFRFCANYAKKIVQKRTNPIALDAQKFVTKEFAQKIRKFCAKQYSHFVENLIYEVFFFSIISGP